jgi:hypothetical protein
MKRVLFNRYPPAVRTEPGTSSSGQSRVAVRLSGRGILTHFGFRHIM